MGPKHAGRPACTSCARAPSSTSALARSATEFVCGTPDSACECGIPKFAAAFMISELLSECICMQRFCPSRNDIACWCVFVYLSCNGHICFSPVNSSLTMNAYFGLCPCIPIPTGSVISTACQASSLDVTVSAVIICPGDCACFRYDPRYFSYMFEFCSFAGCAVRIFR